MLKPDRFHDINKDVVDYFFNTVAERGGIASMVLPAGSGGYPGQVANSVAYAANPSGAVPVGLLLHDVVTYDTNRQHENLYKAGYQQLVGRKAHLSQGQWFTTNMIPSGVSPSGGQPAYLAGSGLVSNAQASGAPRVGTWKSSKDADGYAALRLDHFGY
jgi:hypothetical protein